MDQSKIKTLSPTELIDLYSAHFAVVATSMYLTEREFPNKPKSEIYYLMLQNHNVDNSSKIVTVAKTEIIKRLNLGST